MSVPSTRPTAIQVRVRALTAAAAQCMPWHGRPSEYQAEARLILADRIGASHEIPWIYVTPTCETKLCLQEEHLKWFRAQRIAYPAHVCIYCGLPGYTKDHLLPVTVTGEALRKFVAVVPSCLECNDSIGTYVGHRISERREAAHKHLRKKHRKLLDPANWTPEQLAELGPNLRGHIQQALNKREVIQQRLEWPWDPDFDRRAFEKSGFDDPIGMDLL